MHSAFVGTVGKREGSSLTYVRTDVLICLIQKLVRCNNSNSLLLDTGKVFCNSILVGCLPNLVGWDEQRRSNIGVDGLHYPSEMQVTINGGGLCEAKCLWGLSSVLRLTDLV